MQTNEQARSFRRRELVAFLVLAASTAACSAIDGRQSAGAYVDDASITARVKTAILQEPALGVTQIGVETFDGEVQLTGFVDEPRKAARAEELARHVAGVKFINNHIVVRRARTEPSPAI